MKVYKIVQEVHIPLLSSDCKLVSAYHHSNPEYSILYVPGEFVKPKIGKIMVFQRLSNAREFQRTHRPHCKIWRCTAKNVGSLPFVSNHFDSVERFWSYYTSGDARFLPTFVTNAPLGTLGCDELRLDAEVR